MIKGADVSQGVSVLTEQRSQMIEVVEKLQLICIDKKLLAGHSVSEMAILCEKVR